MYLYGILESTSLTMIYGPSNQVQQTLSLSLPMHRARKVALWHRKRWVGRVDQTPADMHACAYLPRGYRWPWSSPMGRSALPLTRVSGSALVKIYRHAYEGESLGPGFVYLLLGWSSQAGYLAYGIVSFDCGAYGSRLGERREGLMMCRTAGLTSVEHRCCDSCCYMQGE